MRTIVALIQIIVAMLAILALVLWEKRDRNTSWMLSLCLLVPALLVPQIFEDSDQYAMCMRTDDETKQGIPSPSSYTNGQYNERLAPPGQMYSEPVITPPTDSMYYTEPVDNEELASYKGLGHRNWFYDTARRWPVPPNFKGSDLLEVPQQDTFLWSPINDLAADINEEGGQTAILQQIEQHIPQGKPIYYGLALPIPTSLNEFILMYESLFRTKCHVSRDIAHLHLNIEANQKLIEQCTEILESIDQNQDLLDSVHRWNHTITSDAWQKSHRSVGIGPAYINQELEATIGYMDTASYYYHKGQYGQDLTRGFWPNGSENNDPNKFTSHPGYNPMARRLKAFAIVAAISGLTYKVCDYMFFI